MSEDALVRGINKKDPRAFSILFNDHLSEILLTIHFKFPRYAEENVLFAMGQLWLSKTPFNTLENIKAFLYTTAANKCLEHIQQVILHDKLQTKNKQVIADNVHGPVTVQEEDIMDVGPDMLSRLHKAIQDLPQEERRVIVLAYLEGLSNKEIAERLGKSYASIAGLKKRAVKRLKDMLL